MKHMRIIALSLALVLMMGLFTACSKNNAGSEDASSSQPDTSVSMPEADMSAPGDASQPVAETLAPEEKPEEKPVTPEAKPQQKPEDRPQAPAPGKDEPITIPGPETPTPEVKPEEKPVEPTPEATPEEKPEAPAPADVDLAAFYQTILASAGENAPFMMELDNETAEAFYPGITTSELNQRVMYMPGMSAVACEIAMVECANVSDVENVKAIFQARIDTQVNGGAWYPQTIEGWQNNSKIVVKGNYVCLFVIPEGMMDAASEFEKLF